MTAQVSAEAPQPSKLKMTIIFSIFIVGVLISIPYIFSDSCTTKTQQVVANLGGGKGYCLAYPMRFGYQMLDECSQAAAKLQALADERFALHDEAHRQCVASFMSPSLVGYSWSWWQKVVAGQLLTGR